MEEGSSHIAEAFDPVPVYYIFGRSAVMQPKCQKEHCLYYTWKDVMMVNPWFIGARGNVLSALPVVSVMSEMRVSVSTLVAAEPRQSVNCVLSLV